MEVGAGKYDPQLKEALSAVGATQGVLIVLDGEKGGGFSCAASLLSLYALPGVLRQVADELSDSLAGMQAQA